MFYPGCTTCLRAFLVAFFALGQVNAAPTSSDNNLQVSIAPPPQEITSHGKGISLNNHVTIVTGNATDKATIDTVKAVVSSAGGKAIVSSDPSNHGTQIIIGTETDNNLAAIVAKKLTGDSAKDLDADGYVLASGQYKNQPSIVLNGVDKRGTFYASQTLRQLINGHDIPAVQVRDWPLMTIRGSIEGFYGVPWSHKARLDQLVFYGKHKINTYIYTPKDDPLLRSKWRTLYEGEDLDQLKELIDTANTNHVDFTFALSPGNDLCYSSDADYNSTIAKFDQARNLGVNSFYIAFDDIPTDSFHCPSDQKKWNSTGKTGGTDDLSWLATSQTYYLNRIQKNYITPHSNLNDLETVPTNYAGSAPDPYKETFGKTLNKNISIQWTGEGVFSDTINDTSVQRADKSYVTDKMFLWDNFPVNDGNRDRLFLNPLTGRASNLYKYLLGFTSNPMEQAYASMPALANYADYTWNGPKYDAEGSMATILRELAGEQEGDVLNALLAFVDINQNWPYRVPEEHAPELSEDIAEFWKSYRGASSTGSSDKEKRKTGSGSGSGSGSAGLRNRLTLLASLPDILPKMDMKGFAEDVEPWSTLAMQWAKACEHLIGMLDAVADGDKGKADSEFEEAQKWVKKTKAKTVDDRNEDGEDLPNSIVPKTGDGLFDTFLANATSVYKWQ